jgi:hypothetical protein
MDEMISELKLINWGSFFNFIENEINKDEEFNTPSGRFKKEEVMSSAIEVYSNDKLKYVNEQGYDFTICLPISSEVKKLEWKTQINCILTPQGKLKRNKFVKDIKLSNTMGQARSEDSRSYEIKFDHLMVVDTGSIDSYCVYVVDKETIINNNMLKYSDDGVIIKLPIDKLICIVDNKTIKGCNCFTEKKTQTKINEEFRVLIKQKALHYLQ